MSVDTVCRPSAALAKTLGCVQSGAACVRVSRVRAQASSRFAHIRCVVGAADQGWVTGCWLRNDGVDGLTGSFATVSEDMQQDAIDCAAQAMEKYNIEKDIAAYIKKEFDKKYNPTWHCIVGRNFGSYVTHETKHFIYFYLGQVAILLFKSG